MIVIGLGTGRSGSYSLTNFLGAQRDSDISHENYWCPWECDEISSRVTLLSLLARKKRLSGDVACYLLPYVEELIESKPDIKFVCLRRDKDATVNSWMIHTGHVNHWTDPESEYFDGMQNSLSFIFPKYDLPKREAIERYWEDYYAWSGYLEEKYPDNFRLWDIEALNGRVGQDEILEFIGIPTLDRVYKCFHDNRSGRDMIIIKELGFKDGSCSECSNEAEYTVFNKTLGIVKYLCKSCTERVDNAVQA